MTLLTQSVTQWLANPPAGFRLLALLAISTTTFLVSDWRILSAILACVVLCYPLSSVTLRMTGGQIRPMLFLLTIICGAQYFLAGPLQAAIATLRFLAIILLASLITLTTPSSALVASFERALTPLRWLGVDPARISLALSMTLRFLALIAQVSEEVREAQRCRGLERSFVAVAVPTILRMLKMADDIAAAIDARSGCPPSEMLVRTSNPPHEQD